MIFFPFQEITFDRKNMIMVLVFKNVMEEKIDCYSIEIRKKITLPHDTAAITINKMRL
jgi:hypothetical protein